MINRNFKKVAILAAKKGGEILKKHFGKVKEVSFKEDLSLVTNADLEAERTIIKLLKKNFPGHNILSEEQGGRVGEEYTWIIDPLDGTSNYLAKFPFFSTTIGLLYRKEPILAVIFDPISQELYFAEKGKGAFLNNRKTMVSNEKVLEKAILLFTKGRGEKDSLKFFRLLEKIGKGCRTFRIWGAASLSLCYLASGRVEAHIDIGDKLWDFVAGVLIVKEAGGKVTDFKGNQWQINSKEFIASNAKVHNQILELLK